VPPKSVLAILVQAADSLSGARPGARKELLESYVKRLEELENLALDFDGVAKAYAIQAGREIRVVVDSEQVDDDKTFLLCKDISKRIEENLTYPGQIRVTVIREKRAVGSPIALSRAVVPAVQRLCRFGAFSRPRRRFRPRTGP
jgi:ribonuclease Y